MVAYIISITTSVVSAMLVFILQNLMKENKTLKKEREEKQKAIENGVLCLLRTQMMNYHTKYAGHDTISSYVYTNWTLMYQAYKSLGGNGMIEHMNEEIEEIHIKKERNG